MVIVGLINWFDLVWYDVGIGECWILGVFVGYGVFLLGCIVVGVDGDEFEVFVEDVV